MVHVGNWRVYSIRHLLLKVEIWQVLVLHVVFVTIRTNSNCCKCITDSWNLFEWQPHFWYFRRPNIDVWLMRYTAGSDAFFRMISQVLLSLPVHCKFGTCNYVIINNVLVGPVQHLRSAIP